MIAQHAARCVVVLTKQHNIITRGFISAVALGWYHSKAVFVTLTNFMVKFTVAQLVNKFLFHHMVRKIGDETFW
jgi:hypothetical protein